jgi:TatD DNase family protein
MLIDSHAHLDMDDYKNDLDKVLKRAREGGLTHIITVGIDLNSSIKALDLAKTYDFIYSTIGFHPHNADDATEDQLDQLKLLSKELKVVAWGEIGLDFYRGLSSRERQVEIFKNQLDLALEADLPVIIHNRDADREVMDILRDWKDRDHKGVIHCFSGDYDLARDFLDLGYYISIPGVVTFKNASRLREVAAGIPVDLMLIETDCPYLAPVPKRGKRNEPLYVSYTAKKIAQIRGMDFEELALRTSENAKRLFRLD